jgi:hypothetical protein
MSVVAASGAANRLAARSQSPAARRAALAGLFALGLLISGFTIRRGIQPFDEGLTLQAARRVLEGQLPYRDFTWAYGPAEPYLLAGLFKLFGVSLIQWRILRCVANAALAIVCLLMVERRVPRSAALAVWLAVACGLAQPFNTSPSVYALLPTMVALFLVSEGPLNTRTIVLAGILTGVAAAFRFDVALFGLAAEGFVVFLRGDVRRAVGLYAIGLALGALVYLPFAILTGPGALYQALIGHSVHTRAYWTLPFPLDFQAPAQIGLANTIVQALDFYLPLICTVSLGVIIVGSLFARWRGRSVPVLLAGLGLFGIGMLEYLIARTDDVHAQPLLVVVAPGLALVATVLPRLLRVLCLVLLGLLVAHGVADRLWQLTHPPAAQALDLPIADGVEVAPPEATALRRLVAVVDARVSPYRPIYVLPRRSDLVTVNDPLLYVLTARNNPSREDYGLQTGAAAQAQIVAMLRRLRLPVLIRWTDPISSIPEPNLRGISSGVQTVDRWVAAHYRPLVQLDYYQVLVPRQS